MPTQVPKKRAACALGAGVGTKGPPEAGRSVENRVLHRCVEGEALRQKGWQAPTSGNILTAQWGVTWQKGGVANEIVAFTTV